MADNVENSDDHSYSANSDDDSYNEKEEIDRDEVKEMRKLSSKDTTRIRLWRFVVTFVLLLTACAVTFTTYSLLRQQEHQNFVTAVCYVLCFNLIISNFAPYPPGTAFAKFYHDGLHSQINGSDVSFPHSIVHHPIHSIPGDFNSDVVAYAIGGVAWDFSLRFLLPEGVDGIIVEVENNYNRSVSYRLSLARILSNTKFASILL
jgi:hypothetical protein